MAGNSGGCRLVRPFSLLPSYQATHSSVAITTGGSMRSVGEALLLGLVFVLPLRADNRAVSSGRDDVVYLAPATESYEALPIGNGRLGATVWNERGMSYQLNHGSFFASANENEMLVSSGHIDLVLPEEWMKGFVEERL